MTDLFPPKRDDTISVDGAITRDHSKFLEELTDIINFVQIGDGDPIGTLVTDRKMIFLRQDGTTGTTLYINELGDGTANGWRAI